LGVTLENHPLGKQFHQAEIEHLQSHRDMRSWTEIRSRTPELLTNKSSTACGYTSTSLISMAGSRSVRHASLSEVINKPKQQTQETYAATLAGRSFRTLIAVSRVRTLGGLLFDEPFDFEQFAPRPGKISRMREEDYVRRSRQHVQPADLNRSLPSPFTSPQRQLHIRPPLSRPRR
jgi:hypothetical protein